MRYARIAFWLLLLPAGLLFLALQMNRQLLASRAEAQAQRLHIEHEERRQQVAEELETEVLARINQRRALARQCVARALQTVGSGLADAPSVLVVVGHRGCGEGCDTDAIAAALADAWIIERLHVLLIRTLESELPPTPAGLNTVVMSDCAPLVAEHGDDYFFRDASGQLSSSGERHEAALRSGKSPPFDPAPLVRDKLRQVFEPPN
jgi:hypothetical protein